jgi:very-short-patch-repair endonuclease
LAAYRRCREPVGRLRHELRRWYRPIYRDVLIPKNRQPTLITGVAASALHGAKWVKDDIPVELIMRSARRQTGLIIRNERVAADEITVIDGVPATTPARTAFDLGRHLPEKEAIPRLDALARAAAFSSDEVLELARRYSGARGLKDMRKALRQMDAGAQSPKETWLRLLLVKDGLPKPATQVPVDDGGYVVAYLDLGWEEYKVAVEYDGDQHPTDRRQYVKDLRRIALLEELGWIVIRVVKEDGSVMVLRRVREALRRRGFREFDGTQCRSAFAA